MLANFRGLFLGCIEASNQASKYAKFRNQILVGIRFLSEKGIEKGLHDIHRIYMRPLGEKNHIYMRLWGEKTRT